MLNIVKKTVALVTIVIAFLAIITTLVLAQEKSGEILHQLEKKELVPKETPEKPAIEQKQEKPKEITDDKRIFIRQIKVQGNTLIDEQTVRSIIHSVISLLEKSPLPPLQKGDTLTPPLEKGVLLSPPLPKGDEGGFIINKELTLTEINQIAEDITAKYREQGYILAYTYIPEQEIKDWILEIVIIEGKTGEIAVTGNKSYSKKFILKHLDRIKKDPSPKKETIERALLILNEYPDLNVEARLKAGKDFGATDIIAEAKDSLPISGSLSYDNFGSDTTSKNRLNAAFNIGNLLTSGDYLMLSGLTGIDRIDLNKLSYGRLGYLFPINYNGTKIGINYANSIYEAGEQYTILNIYGKARVAGIYITHPIIKTREKTLDARFGFDYKNVYDYMLASLRSKDNIRVFNLGMTYDFTDKLQGRNIISLTYYQGVRGLFGGNGSNDPGTSRLNADGAFAKYTFDATRVQKLPGYNHFILKASGQISDDALFVAEQFYIGGAGSVRDFRQSLQSGDSGYLVSAELHLSPIYPKAKIFNQNLGDTIKLVLFADHGGVYKNNVQPGENKDAYLTSIGTGLRLYYSGNFSFRFDWAVPKINGNFNTKNSATYLQTVVNF